MEQNPQPNPDHNAIVPDADVPAPQASHVEAPVLQQPYEELPVIPAPQASQTVQTPPETPAPLVDTTCRNCQKTVPAGQKFCTNCGFPVNATPEEEDQFYYRQGAKQLELDSLGKTVSNAKNALWVVAGLMGVIGIGLYFIDRNSPIATITLISNLIVAAIFVALGFWASQKPFTALLVGLILYITIYLLGVIVGGANPVRGIIMHIIIITYLVRGINSAREVEQLKKELNR